ncbi:S8 family serine peptidase [Micromonospora sp. NPDC050200]|uniref:S8 family serine peptidase n=1 Tax=Micromonospora sp. NPDC050200 TaxID=3155664 RepID=UPI0033EB04FA
MPVMSRTRRALMVTVAALMLGVGPALPATAAGQAEGTIENAGASGAIKDRYIVVLGKGADADSRNGKALAAKYGAKVKRAYDRALNGYAIELTEKQAKRFAANPAVESVVQDQTVKVTGTDPAGTQLNPPSWGLDRIDQPALPLDSSYTYAGTAGRGVTAYIIDTGVRISHEDFGGRASYGYDAVDGDNIAADGNGHGTHVAGTVAGSSHGVAKEAKIVAVRVLDDAGNGTISGVIAGVDWVTANAVKPAVANMSLSGGANTALDTAVRNSIASGITYAVAAGNENRDVTSSPARVAEALTVGSTTDGDARSSFSNYGSAVDIFAPGSVIKSAWYTGDTATNTISGTSMASPHVAGAAALYLADNPTATPSQVAGALTSSATTGVVTDPGTGSPNLLLNVSAFFSGPRGTVTGTVTDGTAPLAAAKVTVGDVTVMTDGQGRYSWIVPPGTHDISASKFGYATKTVSGVTVADGQTVTQNLALTAKPRVNVTGTVRDGSGHGWPLYATVRVKDEPTAVAYTDPKTGKYTLSLPAGDTYTLQVDPLYPGYQRDSHDVQAGSADVTHDVNAPVDQTTCSAAGYHYAGTTESFDGGTMPAGWTVDDKVGNGQTWVFNDPGKRFNRTGDSSDFAIIDSYYYGSGKSQDTSLISPVTDFSQRTHPSLHFRTDYWGHTSQTGDIDLSVDGGQTWTTVWHHGSDFARGPRTEVVDLSQAAGKTNVQVRFHFTGSWGMWWQVDEVFLGDRTCEPTPGGLVVGRVTDKNTGAGINGATVTSADKPAEKTTSAATPNDPNLGDGFYWMFSSLTGEHTFTATARHYSAQDITATLAPNQATDGGTFALPAPRIAVSPAQFSKTVDWQGQDSAALTVKNTGTAPVTAKIGKLRSGYQPAATQQGAPLQEVKGNYSPLRFRPDKTTQTAAAEPAATPYTAPWTTVADYPVPIMDNAAATIDGKVYSVGGTDGMYTLNKAYVYDPEVQAWSALPSLRAARTAPQTAAYGGKLYVFGGWGEDGNPAAKTEIYDPATGAWSTGADNPKPYGGAAVTVLGSKIYIVGGCATACGKTDVQVYDPAANSWSSSTAYPQPISWLGCGAVGDGLYCAGGTTSTMGNTEHAYSYDPASDRWAPVADLPIDLWAMGYSVADGKLLLSGGVTDGQSTVTNRGFAYDPGSDTWTALANSNYPVFRGGSACGFYKIGGSLRGWTGITKNSELLPGYDQCGATIDVPWLSVDKTEVTLQPGESVDVAVSFNANVAEITQPGTFTARLTIGAKTPYGIAPVPVTFVVNPAKTWGKITGTVTGVGCTGKWAPLTGATVQITSKRASYTLKTDQNGQYVFWLDASDSPLTVVAAKDGWAPQTQSIKAKAGKAITADFSLKPDRTCT